MMSIYLSWATLSSLMLFLAWFFSVPASVMQVWLALNRRADPTPEVVKTAVAKGAFGMLRLVGIPVAAYILLQQAWRLDPYTDGAVLILSMGWVAEIVVSAASDYSAMKKR